LKGGGGFFESSEAISSGEKATKGEGRGERLISESKQAKLGERLAGGESWGGYGGGFYRLKRNGLYHLGERHCQSVTDKRGEGTRAPWGSLPSGRCDFRGG